MLGWVGIILAGEQCGVNAQHAVVGARVAAPAALVLVQLTRIHVLHWWLDYHPVELMCWVDLLYS